MLQLISYFEGHGGAVTSLVKADIEQTFYSGGSEGLIVRWNLAKPNEGEVLLKLSGYISALVLEPVSNTLYATVNHKGLFSIDIKSRKVVKKIETPSTSFGKMEMSTNFIALSTNIGELLLIDKESLSIKQRIRSSLSEFPSFAIANNNLIYCTNQGINQLDIGKGEEKKMIFSDNSSSLNLLSDRLIFAATKGLYVWNLVKGRLSKESIRKDDLEIRKICSNPTSLILLALSQKNVITKYKIEKKKISKLETIQIEQNGQINDILWFENHKFVITAGADTKIGVWQLN